jgi:hypothetical protein
MNGSTGRSERARGARRRARRAATRLLATVLATTVLATHVAAAAAGPGVRDGTATGMPGTLRAAGPGLQVPTPVELPAGGRPPTARELRCASDFGLPLGPIGSCRDALLATAVTVTAVTGFVAWWHRGLDTRFDVAHEGWFGPQTYSGGIDKLGHAFSFYVATRMLNRGFGWAGLPAGESLPLSMALALGLGLGIETLDALARGGKYGFSWEDLVMDGLGIGLGWLAESDPSFDRWFAFRWLRSSGGDPQRTYDHHQYYAVLRLSGWSALGPYNPLRYLELMVGYGATGFRGDSPLDSAGDRARTVYAGIGLNLTELLDRTAFSGSLGGGRAHWFATELLRYVQVPGTAAFGEVRTWRP